VGSDLSAFVDSDLMVGIAGFIHDRSRQATFIALSGITELLTAGSNVRPSRTFCDDHLCCVSASLAFHHRQPYISPDLVVWLDGEIYDLDEIAGEINVFENTTTTAIAALYRRQGLEFLKTTDGVFAAVIYDRKRMTLHLVTDRYGLRRLYIWKSSKLAWASALKCFLPNPTFSSEIDPAAVDDFIDLGYMTEERTWFKDVSLLPSGSVLTWDILRNSGTQIRYWWWDKIKPLSGWLDESAAADELGTRFVRAVEKRVRPGERIGVELSGGLDSRAVLAATPDYGRVLNTVTFGIDGCADRLIAARAAAVRGAANHGFSLDGGNWLLPRFRAVWLVEGQTSLLHMHGFEGVALERELFDIALNGFLGDVVLGGSWLAGDALDHPITPELVGRFTGRDPRKINVPKEYLDLNKTDFYHLQNRARRFTYNGLAMVSDYIETRIPFYDNKLLEFSYSLPDSIRLGSHIYKKMLLGKFPNFYRRIPWQKTGNPIGMPDSVAKLLRLTRRARRKLSRLSGGFFRDPLSQSDYTDYPSWLRQEPARTIFTALLNNRRAIYPEYLPRSAVQTAWDNHLRGADHTDEIFKYATFEIWLQQAFEKRLRAEADVHEFVQNTSLERSQNGPLDFPNQEVGTSGVPYPR
jgi:asparagine synthase (glutamine-hydrolysing)